MSSILGNPEEHWPLSKAVDALADSARRAGVPGWIWLVGIFYPSLSVNYDLVTAFLGFVEHATEREIPFASTPGSLFFLFGPEWIEHRDGSVFSAFAMTLVFLPVFLLLYRLIVGLAKVSDPLHWQAETRQPVEPALVVGTLVADEETSGPRTQSPRLSSVWRAGKGLGASACGMWIILFLLLSGAMIVLLGPPILLLELMNLDEVNTLVVSLLLPVVLFVALYAVILQVLNQLAMHSLAHNKRGVASALTHAWRLVRTSPWAALRATLVDFSLFLFVFVAAKLVYGFFGGGLSAFLVYALYGFAGVTRAGYWARTYRALGGLSAEDSIPGLAKG